MEIYSQLCRAFPQFGLWQILEMIVNALVEPTHQLLIEKPFRHG